MVVSRLHSLAAIQCNEHFGTEHKFRNDLYIYFILFYNIFFLFGFRWAHQKLWKLSDMTIGRHSAVYLFFIHMSLFYKHKLTHGPINVATVCATCIQCKPKFDASADVKVCLSDNAHNGQRDSFRRKIFRLTSQYGRMSFFKWIDGRCQLQTVCVWCVCVVCLFVCRSRRPNMQKCRVHRILYK